AGFCLPGSLPRSRRPPAMFGADAPWVGSLRWGRRLRATPTRGNDQTGAAMSAASALGPATTHPRWRGLCRGVLLVLLLAAGCAAPAVPVARASTPPDQDPFYRYEGKTRLRKIAPGTVLKTRSVPFHLAGIETPITAVQLLYRSTSALGKPTVNV